MASNCECVGRNEQAWTRHGESIVQGAADARKQIEEMSLGEKLYVIYQQGSRLVRYIPTLKDPATDRVSRFEYSPL